MIDPKSDILRALTLGEQSLKKWAQIARTDKSTTTTGSWVEVDCSGIVPEGAIAVSIVFVNTGASAYSGGARKKGATDEGTYFSVASSSSRNDIVELDANRKFEQKIENIAVDTYIIAYQK